MEKNYIKPYSKYVIADCIRFYKDEDPVLYERMVRKKKRQTTKNSIYRKRGKVTQPQDQEEVIEKQSDPCQDIHESSIIIDDIEKDRGKIKQYQDQ